MILNDCSSSLTMEGVDGLRFKSAFLGFASRLSFFMLGADLV
jgi:hypothetical protein